MAFIPSEISEPMRAFRDVLFSYDAPTQETEQKLGKHLGDLIFSVREHVGVNVLTTSILKDLGMPFPNQSVKEIGMVSLERKPGAANG
jgi:hypothetical protein